MYRDAPHTVRLDDYQPPEFLIDRVDLRFELDADATSVEADVVLRRNPASPRGDGSLTLHGEQLELERVAFDGRELLPSEYRRDDESLRLHRVPDRFVLQTRVRIHPVANTKLEGLYQSGPLLCTQCEAEGFRRITYFLDRPDVMARFSTTLIASRERYPVLLSNGNPVEVRELDGGRHLVRWEDPFPKPSYLFALVAGDLHLVEDRFVTASGREIALHIYVEAENLDKCAHAMASLQKAMRWDEERYGREYDLDIYMIVAVSHFNMGAMENKGLNVFNAKYVLARPDSATDQDFLGIEGVIAHEYFHNWTGNRITCRDWFQLSLKEGFTVFRDQEFSADMGARDVKRIADVRALRSRQFAEDASPMAHPVRPESYIEINNFYTSTVYEKGAEVVRMQAHLLGPERFRMATDLYFERYDGQAVTTEDFVCCMEEGGDRDLRQFRRWYSQAGTPELRIQGGYDAVNRIYDLSVRQQIPPTPGQPHKKPQHIPIALGLLAGDGRDLPLRLEGESAAQPAGTRLVELTEAEQRFRFLDVPERPIPSLLRGFSAPVKVDYAYSDEELMFLMAHDSDGFGRWDASQTLYMRVLLQSAQDSASVVSAGVVDAFRSALTHADADPALLAEVLSLPSESYIGDQMEQVDVDGIYRAREGLRSAISMALYDDLLATYRATRIPGPYTIDPVSIGRRALANQCLDYLVQCGRGEAMDLAKEQHECSTNMTDSIAALRLLVDAGGEVAEQALEHFYQKWSSDALVLDKWFAIQAAGSGANTLQRVKGLMHHKDFALTNPNRVRSLVGVFCMGNPVRFHGADGAGYRFLADRVLELDPLNPQIAARLLQAIARWRRYDPRRQALMQAELSRILDYGELSKDTYEVASKSLD